MNSAKIILKPLLVSAFVVIIAIVWVNMSVASDGDSANALSTSPAVEIVLASDVNWEPLNSARGANSPQAATLWGDLKEGVATGFLAKFVDGFSSPPHIHKATYRAVVISGNVHNDDPNATAMWMPPGSFWTQPKGEVHITAARGANNVALVEIDQGPYLVLPPEEAFESGERPINVDISNIVWVDAPGVSGAGNLPKMAYLWGSLEDGYSHGSFLKLPAEFNGRVRNRGTSFRAVVIKGQPSYLGRERKPLPPGSYFGAKEKSVHKISSDGQQESVLYVRTNARYDVIDSDR